MLRSDPLNADLSLQAQATALLRLQREVELQENCSPLW